VNRGSPFHSQLPEGHISIRHQTGQKVQAKFHVRAMTATKSNTPPAAHSPPRPRRSEVQYQPPLGFLGPVLAIWLSCISTNESFRSPGRRYTILHTLPPMYSCRTCSYPGPNTRCPAATKRRVWRPYFVRNALAPPRTGFTCSSSFIRK
jgi:hypothetical protein